MLALAFEVAKSVKLKVCLNISPGRLEIKSVAELASIFSCSFSKLFSSKFFSRTASSFFFFFFFFTEKRKEKQRILRLFRTKKGKEHVKHSPLVKQNS